jgi:hypothetical protein
MCLEYYPECGDGGDGCCERRLHIALVYAKRDTKRNGSSVPRVYCRRIDFQLYACWAVRGGTRVSGFVERMLSRMCQGRVRCRALFRQSVGRTEPIVFAHRQPSGEPMTPEGLNNVYRVRH